MQITFQNKQKATALWFCRFYPKFIPMIHFSYTSYSTILKDLNPLETISTTTVQQSSQHLWNQFNRFILRKRCRSRTSVYIYS